MASTLSWMAAVQADWCQGALMDTAVRSVPWSAGACRSPTWRRASLCRRQSDPVEKVWSPGARSTARETALL